MSTLYRANVVRVDSEGVFVSIPVLGAGGEWGPLEMLPITLSVGDPVLVGNINDIAEDLALIGKLVVVNPAPVVIPPTPPTNSKYILYYENATARNAAGLTLTSGLTVWLDDEQRLETYTDEGTPGWTQMYAWKANVLAVPTASKIGVGVTSPGATLDSASAASTDGLLRGLQTGDTQPRLRVNHAGLFEWSSGSVAADVTVQRNATGPGLQISPRLSAGGAPSANGLATLRSSTDQSAIYSENTLAGVHTWPHIYISETGSAANNIIYADMPGDTQARTRMRVDGQILWGSGAAIPDTNLYRNAANELKTDDSLVVGINASVTGNLAVTGNVSVTGTMPDGVRRWVNGESLTSASSAIGNTETTILTIPSFTYKANRVYMLELIGLCDASAVPNRPLFRFRKTNSSGTQLAQNSKPCVIASVQHDAGFMYPFKVGGSDVTAVIVLTIQGTGAFNARLLANAVTNIYDDGLVATRSTDTQSTMVAI